MLIRPVLREEWEDALALVWKVFLKFEAPEYPEEGVKSFYNFITDNTLYRMFLVGSYEMMVAVEDETIIGVVAVRNVSHISLLFVDENYHRQGIGRALIRHVANYLKTEVGAEKLTVNAAPYGVAFYHKVGFIDTGLETKKEGILYTPMELLL